MPVGGRKKSASSAKRPKSASSAKRSRRRHRYQSNKSASTVDMSHKRASNNMTMSELQHMAMSLGIPFGGLRKTQLIRKINKYGASS